MIELISLAAFSLLAFYSYRQRRKTLAGFLIIISLCILGIIASIFPDLTTSVAHLFGIGRGLDLIFYFYVVASIALFFRFYLKIKQLETCITILARLESIDKVHVSSGTDHIIQLEPPHELL